MSKQKYVVLLVACFLLTSIIGCGQTSPTNIPKNQESPVPSNINDVDIAESIPLLEEYFPVSEDAQIKVANPTGKVNEKLQIKFLQGKLWS